MISKKTNDKNQSGSYFPRSIKKILRNAILTAGISSAIFNSGCSTYASKRPNQEESGALFPAKQIQEYENGTDAPRVIGSVYGEGGIYKGIFDENPAMLSLGLGYNILNRQKSDGILLFPNARASVKVNDPELLWSNYADMGIGAAYQKAPFIIGVEEVYRESFKDGGKDGDFFRAWCGFWNQWQAKEPEADKKLPNRLWGTFYGDGEYNTLEENLVGSFRADASLDMLNLGGFIIGPYAAGKASMDTEDTFYRYGQVSGGIRIRKGPFNVFLETGYRESFNDKGLEGNYSAAFVGGWIPIGN